MVILQKLKIQDIDQAIRLSDAEKWNQTEKDWELLISTPKNVCLAAVEDGKLIGTATAINYDNEVAWIGMVLVDRESRGRGVSKKLLNSLFEKLQTYQSIKLDATPAGQPVYQNFNFKNEYLIHRMTLDSVTAPVLSYSELSSIKPALQNAISDIVVFDKQVFGGNRKQLIEFLIKNNQKNSWVLRQEAQITGLALGRTGTRFCQIGPVLADSTEDAKKLIAKSLEGLAGKPVVIDILDDKKELIDWLKGLKFMHQRSFIRMYQNENPFPGIPKNQFLICGPEFG